jgi:hypothetical protein
VRKVSGSDEAGGRRWIILQGGNRGIWLRRSATGRVYGDLNNCDVACGGECGGGLTGDGAAGGDVGSARCAKRPVVSVVDAPYWADSQWGSCQHCWLKCRGWYGAGRSKCAHVAALKAGGARMCWARAKVSMINIGAPQCRHTNVGRGVELAGAGSASTDGAGACSSARATSMFFLRVGLASSP